MLWISIGLFTIGSHYGRREEGPFTIVNLVQHFARTNIEKLGNMQNNALCVRPTQHTPTALAFLSMQIYDGPPTII